MHFSYELLLTIRYLSILLHLTGTCLLCSVYKRVRDKIQLLFLINLSVVHFVVVVLDILRCKSTTKEYHEYELSEFEHSALIFRELIEISVYYVTVFIITVHRLMKITLGFKYPVFISVTKAKLLILFLWVCGVCASATICYFHIHDVILRHDEENNIEKTFYKLIFMPLDAIYIILFVSCYSCIFKKQETSFKRSRRNDGRIDRATRPKRMIRIPLLLLTNFLVFAVIPDLAYVISFRYTSKSFYRSTVQSWIAYISIYTSTICHVNDSIIYTFIHPHVRTLWLRKLRPCGSGIKTQAQSIRRGTKRVGVTDSNFTVFVLAAS